MQRILICEADPHLRADLLRAVRNAGYRADEVGSVYAVEERLAEVGFDALILDVAGSADLGRLEQIVAAHPIAVLAIGADPSIEFAVETMKRGARDFLRKPFAVDVLEAALSGMLGAEASADQRAGAILTRSLEMDQLLARSRAAAATEATVLIVGESGTGKELLARYIHRNSPRRSNPFVTVGCGALPESLWESELFGHERGAFSGADEARIGQIAAADGGTLMFDEVSDASAGLQPKLLRVLQEREVQPIGAVMPKPVDVRILATTQRELKAEVEARRFREDLYFRLEVIVLQIPPLRDRVEDLDLLAAAFLQRFADGADPPRLSERGLAQLRAHPFRGNVRELENLMRRASVLYPGREIDVDRLLVRRGEPSAGAPGTSRSLNLRELERRTIFQSLVESDGNRTVASRALGISVRTLRNKIRAYDLSP